ncbi:restriction endonuclease [Flagellimonas baculiformis]|uniref:restriction endonuclease n=1 Tax=Flagellimonas baculiformis TaxID=3067310 RepID=UPI00296F116C|nr:restriction endonuclease [Muricauda sp. D6]
MKKSPIDKLFFELYGYYPNKAGTAYELLVVAALKVVTGEKIKYDQHLRGEYSESDYQIDGLNEDKSQIVEAKDYTLNKKKVGRPDLQKFQGALSDLGVESGLFASATEYTKPAKKYSSSSEKNPLQKQIELYNIRPSTELDEKGRINKFIVNMTMVIPDFESGQMECAWTKNAIEKFEKNGLNGKPITLGIDRFYKEDGTIDCLLVDFTRNNQPALPKMDDGFGIGCWLLHKKYIKYENELYELKGIAYKIPYRKSTTTFTIDSEGKPKVLIKSEDGTINKLLTDEQFRKLTFKDGKVE